MDSRKIVAFGKNSYIVSLPLSWVKENKLQKGDFLYVDAAGDELKITAKEKEEREEPKELTVETKNKNINLITTEIVSAYLRNYSTIKVKGDDLKDIAVEVKNTIHNLAGLEILEQTKSEIIARYLLDTKEISVQALIRRIDIICRSILDDSMQCSKEDEYKSIYQRDMDINRLVFLAYRVMRAALISPRTAKSMQTNPTDVLANWEIAMRIEEIGDQSKRIARCSARSKFSKKIQSEISGIHARIKKKYEEIMNAYYKNDKNTAFLIASSNRETIKTCDQQLKKHHDISTIQLVANLKSTAYSIMHIARSVIGNE